MRRAPLPPRTLALAAAFVVAQIMIPPAIVLMADHLPTPFAWQMFARGIPRIGFEVTFDDGTTLALRPRDILLRDRVDIPFAALLPARLCERPGAAIVRTVTAGETRVHQCD